MKCVQDVLKDAIESNMKSAAEMPYFEGDFWPNILEESIKELEQEEEDKRKREEVEAASSAADVEELATEKEDSGEVLSLFELVPFQICITLSMCSVKELRNVAYLQLLLMK